ncbi:hypothetical protein JCM15831A_04330 [Asaia astilbis]
MAGMTTLRLNSESDHFKFRRVMMLFHRQFIIMLHYDNDATDGQFGYVTVFAMSRLSAA